MEIKNFLKEFNSRTTLTIARGKNNKIIKQNVTSDEIISLYDIYSIFFDMYNYIEKESIANDYFLSIYDFFKKRFLFGDLFATIFTEINGDNITNLNKMTLQFGMSENNIEDLFIIELSLKDKDKLKVRKALLNSQKIKINNNEALNLLKNSYVNKKFLPTNSEYKIRSR